GAIAIFQDDMERGLANWSISGTDGVGGPALWHLSPHRFRSAGNALYYGRETTLTYDTGAPNSGVADSPIIDLRQRTGSWLSFWHLLDKEPSTNFDLTRVWVLSDGGAGWTPVASFTSTTLTGMTEAGVDLSAYDGHQIMLRFDFTTVDDFLNDYE